MVLLGQGQLLLKGFAVKSDGGERGVEDSLSVVDGVYFFLELFQVFSATFFGGLSGSFVLFLLT